MPCSGHKSVNVLSKYEDIDPDTGMPTQDAQHSLVLATACLRQEMQAALKAGMEVEWIEMFLGAWEETGDLVAAASAGAREWDF